MDENEIYCCVLGYDFKYIINDFYKGVGVDCYKLNNNSVLFIYVYIYLYVRLFFFVQNIVGFLNIEML